VPLLVHDRMVPEHTMSSIKHQAIATFPWLPEAKIKCPRSVRLTDVLLACTSKHCMLVPTHSDQHSFRVGTTQHMQAGSSSQHVLFGAACSCHLLGPLLVVR